MIHPIIGEGVGYAMESERLVAAFARGPRPKELLRELLAGYTNVGSDVSKPDSTSPGSP